MAGQGARAAAMDSVAGGWHWWAVDEVESILRWLRAALPSGCAVAGGAIGAPGPSSYAAEEAAIVQAVASRRYEFRAGRTQARRALAELGAASAAIPRGAAGEPRWPEGYTGSISHADGLAVAVVARRGLRAVGLDVDTGAPLDEPSRAFVCRPGEVDPVPALGAAASDPAKRLFVAKEAFMKLNYALTGTLLDFLDIHIGFEIAGPDTHAFRAKPFPAAAGASAGYEGRLGWCGGRIAAIMYGRRSDDI